MAAQSHLHNLTKRPSDIATWFKGYVYMKCLLENLKYWIMLKLMQKSKKNLRERTPHPERYKHCQFNARIV